MAAKSDQDNLIELIMNSGSPLDLLDNNLSGMDFEGLILRELFSLTLIFRVQIYQALT